jgi:peptidoglycan/xylan/chitin deacetylase (PgdA/CDA1 family)
MGIVLTLRAKGVGGIVERVGTIFSRLGVTAEPMARCLTYYADIAAEFDAHPSLPVTACVMARHPSLIRTFVERDVEFAIHGLVHNDHAVLSLDQQQESIAKAAHLFESAGVPYAGFRGPYLRYNQATDATARALGLKYHSSQAVAFDVLPQTVTHGPNAAIYQRALELYAVLDATQVVVRPFEQQGLINIPGAIPDDEIMVDRLHLDDRVQAAAWLAILEATYSRGELFTMQLHPERIFDCAYALRTTLKEARKREPQVWIATLEEIASWWLRRNRAVLEVQAVGDQRYRITLEADPQATLLVRGLPVAATPWYGSDYVAQARSFEVEAAVKPVVGVSTRSPSAVLDFLREEGLPTEISEDRSQFGAYVDIADGKVNQVAVLNEIELSTGPLVRLGRWPAAARSALAVTGDLDSITLQDFFLRLWEARR